ncbi:hypothetical protein [Streptomyces sp. NPDC046909]|uniref:hypothetical protein n=1 Tax=Streptomyces sp. NPDC046909 TaxID=3155617 RepID=UPI00340E1688
MSFFDEVRAAFTATAEELKLTGPEESELIMPSANYKGSGVEYRFRFDSQEGTVTCSVKIPTDTADLTVDVEPLAIAAGIVEKCGGVSYSARNQNQLQKSLLGQADYVRRVHPFLTDFAAAVDLMRKAGADEWRRHGTT